MSSVAWTLVTAAIVLGAIDAAQAAPQPVPVTGPGVTGTVLRYPAMPSQHVAARNVDVWLPPGYDRDPGRRYPVLYMHDGQNLFDPATSYGGVDWSIDETMTRMIAADEVRPAIVVGVWSTPRRREEYMPQRAVQGVVQGTIDYKVPGSTAARPADMVSDHYLAFLVAELKPFIDARYRTLPDRADTYIMGSSMGGLVSQYAISKYPDVYGGAGCVSTHWPAGNGVALDDFAAHLPDPTTHKYYFDYGTATLDESYEPYQLRADAILRSAGYVEGRNWITRRFEGAEHSEKAWRLRVHEPLVFLIGQ